MRTIGIRVAPTEVTFAIFDADKSQVINVERIRVPSAFSVPESLKYVCSNLLVVLREFQVDRAGIRTIEPQAQQPSFERIQIEGVVQEAFASSSLQAYFAGPIATISAKLRIDRKDFKKLVDGENLLDIENWDKMKPVQREAILTAQGAVNV